MMATSLQRLVYQLNVRGIDLATSEDGAHIRFRPKHAMTRELIELIRRHKTGLLELVRTMEADRGGGPLG